MTKPATPVTAPVASVQPVVASAPSADVPAKGAATDPANAPVPVRVPATWADAQAELRTPRDLVRYAIGRFDAAGLSFGHGTDNPLDEAVWLVCWALRLPIDRYGEVADARLTRSERGFVLDLVRRRCKLGQPLAYLIGEAWLAGLRFRADPRALVPRSPIAEVLVGGALDGFLPAGGVATVLDLCTGGASLAIVAAGVFPDARVTGSDCSVPALALAAENVALHDCAERVSLVAGDLFDALADRRFDLIVCNPPYVNAASMDRLPAEYRAEPVGALAGGADGMDLVERILRDAPAHLSDDGLLVLEVGHEGDAFESRFARLEFAWIPVSAGDRLIAAVTASALAAIGPAPSPAPRRAAGPANATPRRRPKPRQ